MSDDEGPGPMNHPATCESKVLNPAHTGQILVFKKNSLYSLEIVFIYLTKNNNGKNIDKTIFGDY
jgi:hypothetical protein